MADDSNARGGEPNANAGQSAWLLSRDDVHWFSEGTHYRLYRKLGAHPGADASGTTGTHFAVWAPNAYQVSVFGSFNGWDKQAQQLQPFGESGIWHGFVPGAGRGDLYKYHILSPYGTRDKADPFAFHAETPPNTASIIWDLDYTWTDGEWMAHRGGRQSMDAPVSIYEVHLGSCMRSGDNEFLNYRDVGEKLAEYAAAMGYTHVELLPIMEHPFYGSWGYQTTGYFAPTSRFGTPQDFMALVDALHARGVGVILDWVPSHFPNDPHGLARFDGTALYEHEDPRQGFHPDWNTYVFNYGRHEVRSFLLSSALFWLDKYHIDGLRVDAVASMLYLDYSRGPGEWIPNEYGGRENLEAIDFLRRFNEAVYSEYPDVQTMAEESTSWPMVSRPTYLGGLGFGYKWDMGWMHDTLQYLAREPIHRGYHHGEITFRMVYAFNENFVLPLSHDEVVHGKAALVNKMPGDAWQKRANLRLLYGYMFTSPGKKLLFMGDELAQWQEWNHERSLDWHLLETPEHRGIQQLVADLNRLYAQTPALYLNDCDARGFQWVESHDAANSVLAYVRHGHDAAPILVLLNFTPVVRENYRVGVPQAGYWREMLNTDATLYGGSGVGNLGGVESTAVPWHEWPQSISLTLPPLAALILKPN